VRDRGGAGLLIIRLLPVLSAEEFDTPVLKSRADKAPHMSTTHLFRAMASGVEVALVVLDIQEGAACVILYEIFLSSARRDQGVGTEVLAAVEGWAAASGWGCMEVWPRSLDLGSRSDVNLADWYGRHGYVSAQTGSERLKKVFPPAR
jgi:GNAT superfamily N-acetyltransferase